MSYKLIEKPKTEKNEKSKAEEIKEQREHDNAMKLSLFFLLVIFGAFGYGLLFLFGLHNSDWVKYCLIGFFVLMLAIEWKYPTLNK